jgi:hypothetical protein
MKKIIFLCLIAISSISFALTPLDKLNPSKLKIQKLMLKNVPPQDQSNFTDFSGHWKLENCNSALQDFDEQVPKELQIKNTSWEVEFNGELYYLGFFLYTSGRF